MLKKIFLSLLFLVLLYVAGVIAYATMTDYQPEESTIVVADRQAATTAITSDTITLMTWNVGYGGLGAESDFFYADGRTLFAGDMMVRPPENVVQKNVNGALQTIGKNPADIYLLQEVDQEAKRSHYINQYERIGGLKDDYEATFGQNLYTAYSPIPVMQPWKAYGFTRSGIATFSKFKTSKTTRLQLPGVFGWPNRLFMLDRCAMEHRYPLANGKELVVYNVHNSAYDKDGSIKRQQTAFLKERWLKAYENGNYVIVGGDWNQVPPFFKSNTFRPDQPDDGHRNIQADLMPQDWRWIYDPTIPTVRDTREVYDQEQTFQTLIDFFLISPNVQAIKAKGIDLGFEYSDHQPVWVEVVLN